MKFKEDYTEKELALHLNRYVKWEWHDEDGNKIIPREEYENSIKETNENFKNRILKENLEAYNQGRSVANEPKLFKGASLKDFEIDRYEPDFVDKMRLRACNGTSFYIMGAFGGGKSRFLWAYVKHMFLELGYRDIILIRWLDVFKETKMVYGSFEYSEYFLRMMTCKTLLIDDIQQMTGSSCKEYNAFIDLLNARLENGLTTCFTSNYMYNNLIGDENSGKRISSRIERLLGSRGNLVIFKDKFYDFE